MFVGFLVALAVASQARRSSTRCSPTTRSRSGLLLAAAVMFVVGAIDDLREVSPPAKIAGQVLSGSVLSLLGVTMLYFRVPFASYEYVVLSPDLAPLVTVHHRRGAGERDQPHRRSRRPRGGHRAHRRRRRCSCTPTGCSRPDCSRARTWRPLVAAITVGVCVGLPAAQLQPGAHHHGRRRRDVPRAAPRDHARITIGGRTADPFSGQTYFYFAPLAHPARDPRRAHLRHRVLVPAAAW